MKQMKKTVLALCIIAMISGSLVACDIEQDKESDEEKTNDRIESTKPSEEDENDKESNWDVAVQDATYENVTMQYTANFISGYEEEETSQGIVQRVGAAVSMDGKKFDDPEILRNVINGYIRPIQLVAKEKSKFTYQAESDSYLCTGEISFPVEVYEYKATVTVQNVVLKFDENGRVVSMTCHMTQQFQNDEGEDTVYVLDTVFTLSHYGTTVLDDSKNEE